MQLLATPFDAAFWLRAQVTGRLCTDSRTVRAGDGFLAWPGAAAEGSTARNCQEIFGLPVASRPCLVER